MEFLGQYVEWIQAHWVDIGVLFYILDKITKATPTKYDDFIIDVLWNGLKKLVGKSTATIMHIVNLMPK